MLIEGRSLLSKATENDWQRENKGFILDTSDLEYQVTEEEEDFARVVVSGEIEVKGEVGLVKEGGRWVLATKPAPAKMRQAPAAEKIPAEAKAPAGTEAPKGH